MKLIDYSFFRVFFVNRITINKIPIMLGKISMFNSAVYTKKIGKLKLIIKLNLLVS